MQAALAFAFAFSVAMDPDPPSPPPFTTRAFNPFIKPTFLLTRKLANIQLYDPHSPTTPEMSTSSTSRQTRRKADAPQKKVILPVPKKVKQESHDEFPTHEVKGTLIAVKKRDVQGKKDPSQTYTFWSMSLAVDADLYDALATWVEDEAGGDVDINPLYHSVKDFKGKEQHNYYVTVDIDRESAKSTDELYWLQGLASVKSPIKVTVEGIRSEFEGAKSKDDPTRVTKTKFELRSVFNTTTQALE